jgi:hypothetical protein
MKSTIRTAVFLLVLTALVLVSCAPSVSKSVRAPESSQPELQAQAQPDLYSAQVQEAPVVQAESALPKEAVANTLPDTATIQTGTESLTVAQSDRMIIKNAEVRLLVAETDNAIDRSMQVVGDLGGYIISSRVWFQEANGSSYKYATISIGVPVTQFETAMRRLRTLAVRVLDENASGQDVTSEYVDLQSQLGNLEATRDRIRTFLDDAKTIEESLRINQELTNLEGQIEQVKGRMSFLANRSAYSTITVQLEPEIPALEPTPTPTMLPTPTPVAWNPGETVEHASGAITNIYQGLIELAIWFFIVLVPLLAPPALLIWGLYRLITRRARRVEPNK